MLEFFLSSLKFVLLGFLLFHERVTDPCLPLLFNEFLSALALANLDILPRQFGKFSNIGIIEILSRIVGIVMTVEFNTASMIQGNVL